jgi:anti-sigma-K factor RskA
MTMAGLAASPDGHVDDILTDLLLGELPAAQSERAMRHIAACAACAQAWADVEPAYAALSLAAPRRTPPPETRRHLVARVAGDARRRRLAERLRPPAAALAGAVVGVLAAWLTLVPGRQATPVPGRRVAVLAGPGGRGGAVYLDAGLVRATVSVWHLPPLAPGRVYEVWWVTPSGHRMGGTFGVDRTGGATVTLALPAGWRQAKAVGITVEPAPGTLVPTSARVVGGALAALPPPATHRRAGPGPGEG